MGWAEPFPTEGLCEGAWGVTAPRLPKALGMSPSGSPSLALLSLFLKCFQGGSMKGHQTGVPNSLWKLRWPWEPGPEGTISAHRKAGRSQAKPTSSLGDPWDDELKQKARRIAMTVGPERIASVRIYRCPGLGWGGVHFQCCRPAPESCVPFWGSV